MVDTDESAKQQQLDLSDELSEAQQTTTVAAPAASPALNDKRDELTELLRSRLIECGWRNQVANMCRDLIQRRGVEQIKLSDIVNEVRTEARQNIPEKIRTEILDKIRQINQETDS